jgi:hypothetical protein|tara:strand:- start:330 stop:455 length:126 start_codon:yes stop_codon:yes gene_type:complete
MPQLKRLGCSEARELNKSKNGLFTHLLENASCFVAQVRWQI